MHVLLSDGGSPRLVKKTEVELAIKPLHPTLIGNTFVIQSFRTQCSRRSSYWCLVEIFFKKDRLLNNENFFCFNGQYIYIYVCMYVYRILLSTKSSVWGRHFMQQVIRACMPIVCWAVLFASIPRSNLTRSGSTSLGHICLKIFLFR